MTDTQFGLLLTALVTCAGTIAGALRWSVNRITKALDDNTASNKADAEAKVKLATELAVMSTKLDGVSDWVERHTPIRGVPVEQPRESAGSYHVRGSTESGTKRRG